MSIYDDMAPAHRQDYADKRRIDDLRRIIEAFIADPPSRADEHSLVALQAPLELLRADSERIDGVWD